MPQQELELTPTRGLVGGLTIQFAEGRWRGRRHDEIGEGVAMPEEGFDLVEPHLSTACPEWNDLDRYGVFELSYAERVELVKFLRSEVARLRGADQPKRHADLLGDLADWLDARSEETPISVLGI